MKSVFGLITALTVPSIAIASDTVNLANPAAVFCEETGGIYSIESGADGDSGICELPNGTRVDAWDHFRANWDKLPSDG